MSSLFAKFTGQPASYDKKKPGDLELGDAESERKRMAEMENMMAEMGKVRLMQRDIRSLYRMGKTLGAGTYGIVREAIGPNNEKVAVKIILKRNVKGNEQMVYDELDLLQRLKHPHIVSFVDWFESRDKYYIVTQLCQGGELFDRICEQGKFTEKDASQVVRQVLDAVAYLHDNSIVHRDLKPENLLYLSRAPDSSLVLADFGIAKMLDSPNEVLNTMAGSFGYAAPEVMTKAGHGKAVDIWSLGVITYTLLCGYSPFRSETIPELIEETRGGNVVFHDRYWRDVSKDAKDFIRQLLQPRPEDRPTSAEALKHPWLEGLTASDKDILPELRSYLAKARLRRGIEMVKLTNRISALKMQEDDEAEGDIPKDSAAAAKEAQAEAGTEVKKEGGSRLSRAARSAIFREVVLAKVRELKADEEREKAERSATGKSGNMK